MDDNLATVNQWTVRYWILSDGSRGGRKISPSNLEFSKPKVSPGPLRPDDVKRVALVGLSNTGKSATAALASRDFESPALIQVHGRPSPDYNRDDWNTGVEVLDGLEDLRGNHDLLILDDVDESDEFDWYLDLARNYGRNVIYVAHKPRFINFGMFEGIAAFSSLNYENQLHRYHEELSELLNENVPLDEEYFILAEPRTNLLTESVHNETDKLAKFLKGKEIEWFNIQETRERLGNEKISQGMRRYWERRGKTERQERALELLKNSDLMQDEIAERVGLTQARVSQISQEVD